LIRRCTIKDLVIRAVIAVILKIFGRVKIVDFTWRKEDLWVLSEMIPKRRGPSLLCSGENEVYPFGVHSISSCRKGV
jgi:hypothetical protein